MSNKCTTCDKPAVYRSACRSCYNKKYHETNKDLINSRKRELKTAAYTIDEEYRERVKQLNRESYRKFAEARTSKKREIYEMSREEILQRNADYARENRSVINAIANRRRTRIAGSGGSFSAEEWESLLDSYKHRCACCDQSGLRLTADHIVPVAKGGTSDIDNIQPLCQPCNSRKGTKIVKFGVG